MQNKSVTASGIKLRLIEETDAKFVIDLRNNHKLSKYISSTPADVNKQANWIKEYKKREKNNEEYYFIIKDDNQQRWGTYRIYNLTPITFTIGSWLCLPGNEKNIAIKADILCKKFGFDHLNYDTCLFDVRKNNRKVLKYHKLFNPEFIDEDDLNFYFKLDKRTFYSSLPSVLDLFDIQI